jgi:hypothetical protein
MSSRNSSRSPRELQFDRFIAVLRLTGTEHLLTQFDTAFGEIVQPVRSAGARRGEGPPARDPFRQVWAQIVRNGTLGQYE